jgi:hypothetical protein
MRQVLIGDVVAAARLLCELPRSDWVEAITNVLNRAHIAHKVMKRTGMQHRAWGNGSMLAAVDRPAQPEPFLSDPKYLAALHHVFGQIIKWKSEQIARGAGSKG